jgi:porphobilinogen synthase
MSFPVTRPRRLRATPVLRDMVRETTLAPDDFIYPMFVVHGQEIRHAIKSMPGIYQLSVDQAVAEAQEVAELGIPAMVLFGVPAIKDALGSENFSDQGIVQQAIRAIKEAVPNLVTIADVCMCEYTDHGHCGIVQGEEILNDPTLEILQKASLSYAQAGADAIKYASAFYGPFREAAEGAPKFGDRKTHQMDPANAREALRELALDIEEGADMVMVKPALPYLDIIRRVREACHTPVVAYNVSGEYAMLKAAAANGWLDERAAVLELLTGIKRAGADLILTYHAKDATRWLTGRE